MRAYVLRFMIAFVFLGVVCSALTAAASTHIVINIPAFRLYLYRDDQLLKSYPIGIGSALNPTLLGETEIINKVQDPTYYPPDWYLKGLTPIPPGPDNPVGTFWLGLGFKGYGIHGTNQPETIGTAASAGCIRMYNEDVEELARLVSIGTKVTFLYETIFAWDDPVTGEPLVLIHPDIYRLGVNRLDALIEALEPLGAGEGLDQPFLGALLKEAAGSPRHLPYTYPLTLDGASVVPAAVRFRATQYGETTLLPLQPLASLLGRRVTRARHPLGQAEVDGQIAKGSVYVGDQAYAPVIEGARALGVLLAREAGGITLQTVKLFGEGGAPTGISTYVDGDRLYLPVNDVARRLGVRVDWDAQRQLVLIEGVPASDTRIIGGKAHLAHDRLATLLGIRIRWTPGQTVAVLESPKVRVQGAIGWEHGFFSEGDVFIPLRLVTDLLGYTLGWSSQSKTAYIQGVPVAGVVRGGRVYSGVRTLTALLPQVSFQWDEELFGYHLIMKAGT